MCGGRLTPERAPEDSVGAEPFIRVRSPDLYPLSAEISRTLNPYREPVLSNGWNGGGPCASRSAMIATAITLRLAYLLHRSYSVAHANQPEAATLS